MHLCIHICRLHSVLIAYGGFGFTSRLWGLTLDTIISMNLVLANGTVTTASKSVNPDLFWVRHAHPSSDFHPAIMFIIYFAHISIRPCEALVVLMRSLPQ